MTSTNIDTRINALRLEIQNAINVEIESQPRFAGQQYHLVAAGTQQGRTAFVSAATKEELPAAAAGFLAGLRYQQNQGHAESA